MSQFELELQLGIVMGQPIEATENAFELGQKLVSQFQVDMLFEPRYGRLKNGKIKKPKQSRVFDAYGEEFLFGDEDDDQIESGFLCIYLGLFKPNDNSGDDLRFLYMPTAEFSIVVEASSLADARQFLVENLNDIFYLDFEGQPTVAERVLITKVNGESTGEDFDMVKHYCEKCGFAFVGQRDVCSNCGAQ